MRSSRSFGVVPHLFCYRAKLEGCILGKSTKVGAKAELSRCVTQAGYQVDVGGEFNKLPVVVLHSPLENQHSVTETYKNEKLDLSDWTAAPNEEASASEDDSE